jgi:hypothetical protein
MVVWECETADHQALATRLRAFLGDRPRTRHSTRQSEKSGAVSGPG